MSNVNFVAENLLVRLTTDKFLYPYNHCIQDHFKLVVENTTRSDWESIVHDIKKEFIKYPFELGWNMSKGENWCIPSTAAQGNLLEAINTTLNMLQFHYMDRDLHRTGNSIVVVSAGKYFHRLEHTDYQFSSVSLWSFWTCHIEIK